jgi:hypothetical protein
MTAAKYLNIYALIYKPLCVLMSAVFVLSAVIAGTSAWRDFSQHKTNILTGQYVPKDGPAPELGTLTITKTVVNADESELTQAQKDTQFEFTVTFSDGGTYVYSIDGGAGQPVKSGGKIKLKHGQAAVIKNIPVGVLYTVTETPVTGYAVSSINNQGNIVKAGVTAAFTNTYTPAEPETGSLRITKQVTREGANPDKEFTFTITFAGEDAPQSPQTFTLKHGGEKLFENIPAGVTYTVTEDDYTAEHYTAAPGEYSGTVINGETALPFVNVYDETPEGKTGSLTISKTVTGDDADENREFSFTVTFSGENAPESPQTFTLKHRETKTFENLPHGTAYTVTEAGAEGYTPSLTAANGVIAGEHTARIGFVNVKNPEPGVTALTIKKIVEGEVPAKDKDKIFTFTVYIDGVPLPDKILLKAGETSSPVQIPVGATYEVREDDYTGDGYTQTSVTGGTGTAGPARIEVVKTNTFTGTVTIEISGEKTWDLSKAPAGTALPDNISIYLKDGGTTVDTAVVTPKDGKWLYTFTAPKYDGEGKEIVYTVEEAPVPGYVPTADGYNLKNTWTEYIPLTVQKVWQGKDDNRPQSVQVQLYKNGAPHGDPVVLSADNEWKHTWPQLESGVVWTVDESNVPQGYKKTISGDQNTGFIITNTYEGTPDSDTVTVAGKKTWIHGSNPESKRPGQITVYIKDGGYIVKQKVITAADNWQWSFELPKYGANGTEIRYSVDEGNVPSYTKTITGDQNTGFAITNTYKGKDYPGDPPPKTGDEGIPRLWLILLFVSSAGLIITTTMGVRQRRSYQGKYYRTGR